MRTRSKKVQVVRAVEPIEVDSEVDGDEGAEGEGGQVLTSDRWRVGRVPRGEHDGDHGGDELDAEPAGEGDLDASADAAEVDDDLIDDELDGDLEDVLRKRKRLVSPLTVGLLGLLLVAGGFTAGVVVERGRIPAGTGTNPFAAFAAGGGAAGGAATGAAGTGGARAGATGAAGAAGAGSGAAGAGAAGAAGAARRNGTFGTVKLVDGNNVYVQTAAGDLVKVVTNADSKVTVSKVATVADLSAGESVIVQGATGADGTVTATSITDAGGLAGAFGGGTGALAGAGGTGAAAAGGATGTAAPGGATGSGRG